MKAGDTVRVTGGEHQGKTGKVLSKFQVSGVGHWDGEDAGSLWIIVVNGSEVVTIHENNLETIPE